MAESLSIREFARRAGCDDKVVRRKITSGHLVQNADGTLNADYLLVDWRKGEALPADSHGSFADSADSPSIEDMASKLVSADGAELWSKADAEKVKENYAARLKQLEYDTASGLVVPIEDVVVAVASEYAVVRNRLLGIGSKVAPTIAVLQSPEEIKALIDAEVIEALSQLTVDVDGERDFDKLRESIQLRFGPSSDEDASG